MIYIDSTSTDDSIERARLFNNIKIYQLTSVYNPAIARNIGAKNSNGNVLFFIDGDMEILPDFLSLVYDEKEGLHFPFVSGQLKNYNYNEQGDFVNNTWQYKQVIERDKFFVTTGGIFLIKKDLWNSIGGMDITFKRGQDLDLGLRLAKKGIKILRKKEIIANHYTVAYTHSSRMWKTLFSGDISYASSFLFRKHIFNPFFYGKVFTSYYTLGSLLVLAIASFSFNSFNFLIIYPIIIGFKIAKQRKNTFLKIIELFGFYPVRDLFFLYYLFVPKKEINPTAIKQVEIK